MPKPGTTTRMGLAAIAVGLVSIAAPANSGRAADTAPAVASVGAVLDDWHAAAASADEGRYFDHLTEDAVFLGTDPTERWTKAQFRTYAHPYFAKGKAWSFRSVQRHVSVASDGSLAWFDEQLATPNLGPCRGSGVLVREGGQWRIAQYNLSVPIPNSVIEQVKKVIANAPVADR